MRQNFLSVTALVIAILPLIGCRENASPATMLAHLERAGLPKEVRAKSANDQTTYVVNLAAATAVGRMNVGNGEMMVVSHPYRTEEGRASVRPAVNRLSIVGTPCILGFGPTTAWKRDRLVVYNMKRGAWVIVDGVGVGFPYTFIFSDLKRDRSVEIQVYKGIESGRSREVTFDGVFWVDRIREDDTFFLMLDDCGATARPKFRLYRFAENGAMLVGRIEHSETEGYHLITKDQEAATAGS